MKRIALLLVFFILLFFSNTNAQTYIPVATTGYSLDGVAENTTAISTTGGALDNSDFVMYSQFYGTLYNTGYGLPNNGTIASGTRTYQLQSYTGFNTMRLFAGNEDSINFVTPMAFPAVSVLGFGTQGAATASITVRFTDNSTQVFSPVNIDDWFTANPAVYTGFDRCTRTTGAPALVGGAGNPRMFGIDLSISCANQGKPIRRIIIKNNSAAALICAFAVAGNLPTYSITTNPSPLCSGGTATISGTGLTSYTWQASGSFLGSNNSSITVNPSSTTVYTLNAINGSCPTYTTVTVNVSSGQPTLSLTGSSQSVCLGAPATITASGALSYSISGSVINGTAFSPTSTSAYTVTGANGCGTASLVTTITVSPLVVTATTPTALVCAGSPATLIAFGAANYTWMPGNSSQTINVFSPQSSAIYTLSGKTGNCSGSATISLNTTPVPIVSITPSSASVCGGESATLTVSGNATTYSWSIGVQNNMSIVVTPTTLSLYYVVGTNSMNCVSTAYQLMTFNPNPTVTATASNPTVCSGGVSGLTALGAANYSWNAVAGGPATFVNPLTTTIYTLTGSLPTGCTASTTVLVNVFLPTLTVSANTVICAGTTVTLTCGPALSYTWSNGLPGLQTVTVNPSASTLYLVSGTFDNQNGLICTASNAVQVTITANPTLTITTNRINNTLCKGETITLTANGAGATGTYSWTGTVNAANSASTTATPTTGTTYTVRGTNNNGCKGSAQITIQVIVCTSLETIVANQTDFNVFPNPAQDEFYIQSNGPASVLLINEIGQTVRTITVNEANAYRAKVEGLSAGIYFVYAKNGASVFSQKIVIVH